MPTRRAGGEFALDRGRRLYINGYVGTYLPVRFNVRPEATVFALSAAEPEDNG